MVFTESWLQLIYLRYVGHVGRVGERRLDVRGVDCEDRLLCCREAVLWRLRVGSRRHGRRGGREARMVDGRLLLGTRQVESLGGLVLMVLQSDRKN